VAVRVRRHGDDRDEARGEGEQEVDPGERADPPPVLDVLRAPEHYVRDRCDQADDGLESGVRDQ
jgi:hypothetical protein